MSARPVRKTDPVGSDLDEFVPNERAQALARETAAAFLRRILTYTELLQHAGPEMIRLSDHLMKTQYAYVTDADDRRCAAEAEACFIVGLAIREGVQ